MVDSLFKRANGTPINFFLLDLDEFEMCKYATIIEKFGGKVVNRASDTVITLTSPEKTNSKQNYFFDVRFIDDCIKRKKLLSLKLYSLGIPNCSSCGCTMLQSFLQTSICICSMERENIERFIRNSILTREISNESSNLEISEDGAERTNLKIHPKCRRKKLRKRVIIEETDSEVESDEVPCSPIIQSFSQRKKVHCPKVNSDESSTSKNTGISAAVVSNRNGFPDEDSPRKCGYHLTKSHKRELNSETEIIELLQPSTSKNACIDVISVSSGSESQNNDGPEEGPVLDNEKSKESLKSRRSIKNPERVHTSNRKKELNIPKHLEEFAKNIVKDKKLDIYGFPHAYSKSFEAWEVKAMIDYLLVSDNVEESKDSMTWQLAYQLKFLPKKRYSYMMANYFKRVILPNIENYGLKPDDLAKFKALGIPPKILDES